MTATERTRVRAWSVLREDDQVVVSRHLQVGRLTLSWERTLPTRWAWRSGGQRTPGPWHELVVPHVGSLILGRDRTLFGNEVPM